MAKKLFIATADGPVEVEAQVVRIYVGNIQERFFIHENGSDTVLSHYDSGQRVGGIGEIILASAVRWGTGGALNRREAAKQLIERIVEAKGADRVRSVLKAAPTINA